MNNSPGSLNSRLDTREEKISDLEFRAKKLIQTIQEGENEISLHCRTIITEQEKRQIGGKKIDETGRKMSKFA